MYVNKKNLGGIFMLGFADVWINVAFLFCIGSTVLCVGYGLLNWNEGLAEEKALELALKETKEAVVVLND